MPILARWSGRAAPIIRPMPAGSNCDPKRARRYGPTPSRICSAPSIRVDRMVAMTFRNLVEIHGVQAERLGPRPALRYRQLGLFHDITWTEYRQAARACAAALVQSGIQKGDRVGLLAENRL